MQGEEVDCDGQICRFQIQLLLNLTEMFFSKRWSKREEVDFYRTVSTFGVEYNKKDGTYDWSRFR